MRIVTGSKTFIKSEFNNEEELENVVHSNVEYIFGEEAIYIPQKSLATASGVSTVPDAIVIGLAAERWYIVEVELAKHGTWNHIAPQVSKQLVAADNPQTRRELTKITLREIEKSENWMKKFSEKKIPDIRIQELLERIMEKEPIIVVPIDAIPPDLEEWAKALKREFIPIEIEKYVESGSSEIAYRIASGSITAPPQPPDEESEQIERPITEEEFLKLCDEPGKIMYHRLKQLAKEKGCKIEAKTQAFSFYIVNGVERFCPIVIWPTHTTIVKWNLKEENGITPDLLLKFRDKIMRIENLANKYGTMKMPTVSTKEGDISEYEIDLFVSAVRELMEPVT